MKMICEIFHRRICYYFKSNCDPLTPTAYETSSVDLPSIYIIKIGVYAYAYECLEFVEDFYYVFLLENPGKRQSWNDCYVMTHSTS